MAGKTFSDLILSPGFTITKQKVGTLYYRQMYSSLKPMRKSESFGAYSKHCTFVHHVPESGTWLFCMCLSRPKFGSVKKGVIDIDLF